MPDPDLGLELELRDFLDSTSVEDYETMTHSISITSTTLHGILLKAQRRDGKSGSKKILAPGTKKKKRPKTPPKEITSGDERQYTREGDKAEAKSENRDEELKITIHWRTVSSPPSQPPTQKAGDQTCFASSERVIVSRMQSNHRHVQRAADQEDQ